MEINNLKMISFRNHKKTDISFDPGLTIIWGENGSGKTSILEAIHSLSFGKSFRTNNKKDLIKKGDSSFYLKGDFKSKNNSTNTVSLSQDIKGNKKITIQNEKINKFNIDKEELEYLRLNLIYSHKCQTRKLFSTGYKVGTPEYKKCILNKGKKINE